MLMKWNSPQSLPPLEGDEVQVWRIEPDESATSTNYLASLLSAEEQSHANRLRIGQTRDHFTIGRATLRILLGNTLKIDPRDVSIVTGVHGKPEIPPVRGTGISFNIAHSQKTILVALGRQGAIGVDVEYFDRSTDIMEVAQANFTNRESDSLAAIVDPDLRLRTFYHFWTRKEAVGKADGRGLLLPLSSFDVTSESMTSHPIRVNESPGEEGKLYFVSDLDLGDKAVAALALESAEYRINTMIFPLESYRAAGVEP
jgi:4'-phosphopantetheinyl transferase